MVAGFCCGLVCSAGPAPVACRDTSSSTTSGRKTRSLHGTRRHRIHASHRRLRQVSSRSIACAMGAIEALPVTVSQQTTGRCMQRWDASSAHAHAPRTIGTRAHTPVTASERMSSSAGLAGDRLSPGSKSPSDAEAIKPHSAKRPRKERASLDVEKRTTPNVASDLRINSKPAQLQGRNS